MNVSRPTPAIQASYGLDVASEKQVRRFWETVDYSAAQGRLNLACRCRDQYERLDVEFNNLRASQAWLADQDSAETAQLLIAYVKVLAPYLRQRGLNADLLRWCEDGLKACDKLRQNPGWLLLLRSEAQNSLGRWEETMDSIKAAIEKSKTIDPRTYAQSILALGRLQLQQGNYKQSLETLSEAESLLVEQSDHEGLATARSEIAAYYLNRRELDQALTLYLEVDQLRRRTCEDEAINHTLLMLGVVYRKKKDYEQAIDHLQQLLKQGEAQRSRNIIATASHHLAWVYLNQGDLTQARHLCGRAIALYDETGDLRGSSDAYEQLGLIALAEGRKERALSYLKQSLAVRRELGNQHGAASSLRRLAVVHLRMGHLGTAIRCLCRSFCTYWRLGVLSRQQLIALLREAVNWTMGWQCWTV